RGLGTPQDLIYVLGRAPELNGEIGPVKHEPTCLHELACWVYSREPILGGKHCDTGSVLQGEGLAEYDGCPSLASCMLEGEVKRFGTAHLDDVKLQAPRRSKRLDVFCQGSVPRVVWVHDYRDTGKVRDGFLEKLQPLAAIALGVPRGQPG